MRKLLIGLFFSVTIILLIKYTSSTNTLEISKTIEAFEKENYKLAYTLAKPLAGQGNDIAQTIMSQLYLRGLFVSKNINLWIKYLKSASLQGNTDAQATLGYMYFSGKYIKKNYFKAFNLIKSSVENGNNKGIYNLAIFYLNGYGTAKDEYKAFELFSNSIENVNSQYQLAVLYDTSNNLINELKAIKWYKEAAESGHLVAQYTLGVKYFEGKNIEKNLELSSKWLNKVAKYKGKDFMTPMKASYFIREKLKEK